MPGNPRWKRAKTSRDLSKKQSAKAEEAFKKAPHSIVFNRGKVGKLVRRLIKDVRLVMEPYTASHLQVRKKNVLKDFLNVASMLNISHFLSFTKSEKSVNLHVGKVPRGPTLTFRVENYSLMQDVLSYIKRPTLYQSTYTTHPLLVMNNFAGTEIHHKLMTSMFQNMFPSINVDGVKLNNIRRCVLLSYNADTDTIDFRHYIIRVVPSGMSRAVRKLIKPKIPDLGRYNDISEYIDQGGNLSESEAENDGDHNQILLPQSMPTKGNLRGSKSAIRLIEVGPRMTLKLHKIEEGFWSGGVLYNSVVTKTAADVKDTNRLRSHKVDEKAERTRVQNENVKKKVEEKRLHKERSLAGMRRKGGNEEKDDAPKVEAEEANVNEDEDDDAAYYLEEVGLPPDKDLQLGKRKTSAPTRSVHAKKLKTGDASDLTHKPKLSKLARQRMKTQGVGGRQSKDKFGGKSFKDGGKSSDRFDRRGKKNMRTTSGSHKRESRGTCVNKGKRSKTRS